MITKKSRAKLVKILQEYDYDRQALLPCLYAAQDEEGYLSEDTISFLAEKVDLPRVEVYSLATFYSLFYLKKEGRYIIRVCSSLSCYLHGSEKIVRVLEEELKIVPGQTTPDKLFTLEEVSCLGICDQAPAMLINDKVYGHLTPRKIKRIIQQCREKRTS